MGNKNTNWADIDWSSVLWIIGLFAFFIIGSLNSGSIESQREELQRCCIHRGGDKQKLCCKELDRFDKTYSKELLKSD